MRNEYEPAIAVEEKARNSILEVMAEEPDAAELGLVVSIAGVDGASFKYNLAMMRIGDAGPTDQIIRHDGLALVVSEADLPNLRGATLKMSTNLLQPGLVIDNPNGPSPQILGAESEVHLSGSVAERAAQVVDQMINPSIAAHGGRAEVAAVEDGVAYIRFGGGCQGCGLASVTLSQGIESTLVSMVPEITKVLDVTDHAGGDNPYYEAAKK